MLLITCPYCGPRDQIEFSYGSDATVTRPHPTTVSDKDWAAYLYLRDNPKGPHLEFWQHYAGCLAWIKVLRDTLTHEITGTALPGVPLAVPGNAP